MRRGWWSLTLGLNYACVQTIDSCARSVAYHAANAKAEALGGVPDVCEAAVRVLGLFPGAPFTGLAPAGGAPGAWQLVKAA